MSSMNKTSDINWIELIKCLNPFHGYKHYRDARTDPLTGYSNGIALREYLANLEKSPKSSVAIYVVDLLGLHNFNEKHGNYIGDAALIATANMVESAVSPISGKVYREHFKGDEFVAVIEDINKETVDAVPFWIKSRCIDYGKIGGSDLNVAVGSVFSPTGENLFNCLDVSRAESSIDKAKFYIEHPELEKRKHRDIRHLVKFNKL